jgi:hypothetical protein
MFILRAKKSQYFTSEKAFCDEISRFLQFRGKNPSIIPSCKIILVRPAHF